MTDISTTTETDALRRLRELKTRLDMARGEGVSGSGFIRALGGHADGFESCQANDAIELLVPQLKRAIDAWQAERDAQPARTQGPVERALREEWPRSTQNGTFRTDNDIHRVLDNLDLKKDLTRTANSSYAIDAIGLLLDELGEPQPRADYNDRLAANYFALRSRICATLGMEPIPSNDEIISALRSRLLPEGCSWPTYEDGAPVSIGDRYVSISGDVRTIDYVTVAIGASALCSHDLNDDVYEPGEHVRRYATVDTWDQLREDATLPPASYCDRHDVNLDQGWEPSDAAQAMALDLIDRAERLARGGE